MNWINYDEWKLMNNFYKKKEEEFKAIYGFSHNKIGSYFKLEYISTINNKKTIFYSINNEKTNLQAIKR